ncbi:MAG: enoyl-CoA hydratase [Alphaproteobacteria bacterium]|nr:enoyl-CoA hydratase [Alphaproteobacteria bacterium]
MEWRTLLCERFEAVLRITTNRPHVLNAQSRVLIRELDEALRLAGEDAGIRVVVIAGAGKHFSAGHDLGSDEEMADHELHPRGPAFADELRYLSSLYYETALRWRDLPKPTIAQVQGYCIMGGLMLAAACDLIVAAEDAQFADRSVRWGGAHVQYFSMPWDLGPRKAKEYLFTGDYLSAREAEQAGLVNRVVPGERLAEETLALAQRIALNDPFALRMAKLSVNEMLDAQGQRVALEGAFKNYMLTIPHRMALGTYGEAARRQGGRARVRAVRERAAKTGDG